MARDTMNVVIVGHVDHGKSTLVGRLLADTGVLGEGKLERVKETCKRQGKAFEYAFLLDALEEEQGQGITIDAARVFFRTDLRDYIIIDAPGHIEFLKNMVTGAARAEAAILLIDAVEGVQENSRRHGYLLSMLGIRQVVVAVNKIDLVGYDRATFDDIVAQYRAFLNDIGIEPRHFVPVSARGGDLVARRSERLGWFDGPTILEALDGLAKKPPAEDQPLRMPVQDVYKFNERGDDRRIIAGRVEAGTLRPGDRVLFSPSNKTSTIRSVEAFNAPAPESVSAGTSAGLTLTEQVFVSRGEIASHVERGPSVSTKFRANLFWLGRGPMRKGARYKLKLTTAETHVTLDSIQRVLDASELDARADKDQIERHDVADVIFRARHPVAFDPASDIEKTGRFVIVDGYDIAGGGIVREVVEDEQAQNRELNRQRNLQWVRGDVSPSERAELTGHPASLVLFTGAAGAGKHAVARALELSLFQARHNAYLLDGQNVRAGASGGADEDAEEAMRWVGEVAHILLDAGVLVVSTTNVIRQHDHRALATQVAPFPVFVVHLGEDEAPEDVDLHLPANPDPQSASARVLEALGQRGRLRG